MGMLSQGCSQTHSQAAQPKTPAQPKLTLAQRLAQPCRPSTVIQTFPPHFSPAAPRDATADSSASLETPHALGVQTPSGIPGQTGSVCGGISSHPLPNPHSTAGWRRGGDLHANASCKAVRRLYQRGLLISW